MEVETGSPETAWRTSHFNHLAVLPLSPTAPVFLDLEGSSHGAGPMSEETAASLVGAGRDERAVRLL